MFSIIRWEGIIVFLFKVIWVGISKVFFFLERNVFNSIIFFFICFEYFFLFKDLYFRYLGVIIEDKVLLWEFRKLEEFIFIVFLNIYINFMLESF